MKKAAVLLFVIALATQSFAQNKTGQKTVFSVQKVATVNVAELANNTDWQTRLINLEMPVPGGDSYRAFLRQQKQIQRAKYPLKTAHKNGENTTDKMNGGDGPIPPTTGKMFEGNTYNSSVPMDNTVAISNDGILVSAINSTIWMYDVITDEWLYTSSLHSFSNGQFGFPSKYDPKVSYDPVNDRFVVVFLRGSSPQQTKVIVGFSQTADPTGEWNFYGMSGNPLGNYRWTDYPSIAHNANDFFITGNLIIPGEPWQTGFDGSVIWQIDKNSGYNGAEELEVTLHSGIEFGGSFVRNITPVGGIETFDSEEMYFLSNRNFALANDTIFVLTLAQSEPDSGHVLTVEAVTSDQAYFLAPEARQADGHTFDTNDSRVLGALWDNGSIYFVQNCLDTLSGVTGVYFGAIDGLTMATTGSIISFPDEDLDIGYPNISSHGDSQYLISFVHTGPNHFSGTSAVMTGPPGTPPSSRVVLKEGDNYVDVINGEYERWGDYTGSQPKYNLPGNYWISGSFGTDNQKNGTWIAELGSMSFVGSEDIRAQSASETVLFPNPATEIISVKIEMPQASVAQIDLFDSAGKLISTLFNDRIKKGTNLLTFNIAHLRSGNYVLRVHDQNHEITTKKITVQ